MLYKKYLNMHIKTSLEYKLNILFISISQFIMCVGEFLAIWLLFNQFKSVGYWSFYETSLMFGIIMTVFSFSECFGRGLEDFNLIVKDGDLDRLLVRPVGICYQAVCSKIEFAKLSKVLFGIIVSIMAICNLPVVWTIWKILVLISTYICGCLVIFGIFMLSAGISVFTVENLEFFNIITYGGKELSYYPINIYNKWITRFFTYIVPFACFNYLPISYIMGYETISPVICALAPIIGALFIIPCYFIFKLCLKKYQSTGT